MIKQRIACFLILLFVSAAAAQAAFLLDRVVAIVNQDVITWGELYKSMEADASPAVKAMKEEERTRAFKNNEAQYLENLITFKLQIQEATTLGVRVSGTEIKETIDGIRKKYGMTETQFQDSLKAEGYSFEEYKKRLGEQILQSKIVNMQVRSKILITDAEVDNYMLENKTFSGSPESYHIRQIFFKRPKDAAEEGRIQEMVQTVYAKAVEGANFAELARQYSEDATRNAGGDLGSIEKGNLAMEFGAALSSMKPGDISKPFSTDKGIHILRLEEITGSKSSADIREEARTALLNKIFAEKYKAWIKSLREKAFIEIRL